MVLARQSGPDEFTAVATPLPRMDWGGGVDRFGVPEHTHAPGTKTIESFWAMFDRGVPVSATPAFFRLLADDAEGTLLLVLMGVPGGQGGYMLTGFGMPSGELARAQATSGTFTPPEHQHWVMGPGALDSLLWVFKRMTATDLRAELIKCNCPIPDPHATLDGEFEDA